MKSIIKYVLPVLTGLFFVLAACEKEDIPYYSDVERINFDYTSMGLSKDTVNIAYGFVTDQYTNIDLELLLTGYAKDYDRVIGLTITSEDGPWQERIMKLQIMSLCQKVRFQYRYP